MLLRDLTSGATLASDSGMSRPLRLHAPNRLHHVFARGDNKGCIFRNDRDYTSFLELLEETLTRFDVKCAWICLLYNHYHAALIPSETQPLWRMMQRLNSRYCQAFNRRHDRVGHVLQGRYGCRIVEDGAYARTLFRYLALNPVAAGRAVSPADWPWSSYRAAVGLEPAPAFLQFDRIWEAFGSSDPDIGRQRLLQCAGEPMDVDFPNPLIFGSERLSTYARPKLEAVKGDCEFAYRYRYAGRPTLDALLNDCNDQTALEIALHNAHHRHGYTLAELGGAVKRHPSTVWRWCARVAQSPRSLLLPPG